MKTLKFRFLAFLVAAGSITACSLGDDSEQYCYTQNYAPASAVTGPETTTVNTPITLNVAISIGNSCGVFNRFAETTTFPKTIAAVIDYTGCECTSVTTPTVKTYTFTAATAGTYELKFTTATAATPIVKTITVTQ